MNRPDDGQAKRMRDSLDEVIESQIRLGNPPEVRETRDRLHALGMVEAEIRRLLACVLTAEMHRILQTGEPFDGKHYAAMLARLPDLPWD